MWRAAPPARVAPGPADVADVIAGIAGRATARATARAALRVADEALLLVVLLIGGRVDEFHAAIDTAQGSVAIGHESRPPGRVGMRSASELGRPPSGQGSAR